MLLMARVRALPYLWVISKKVLDHCQSFVRLG